MSQSEMKSFLLKFKVFRASHWNPLFHAGLLTVFLLLEDRGRPCKTVKIGYLYSNSISKHFPKTFHRFQKARKIWEKNISQSEIKKFLPKSTVFRASHWNPLFHDGLLTVFLLLEDRGRPSYLHFFTVNPYLSIFANYLTSYRKREKYGWKICRKVNLKVFCSNSRSSGLPIEILCFMPGF